jgi:sarcosine oxidase delta subunit
MNERIRQLTEQCYEHDQSWTGVGQRIFNKEKFAELIVQECAEQIIAKGTDWVDFAPSQTGVRPEYWNMAQQIKQHFGVEQDITTHEIKLTTDPERIRQANYLLNGGR